MFLIAPAWRSCSHSSVTTVPLHRSSSCYGLHWIVSVLPARSYVIASPVQLFGCLLLYHGDLLEGEVVHHRCFAPSQCTPLLLQLLPLFSALGALSEKNLYFAHVLRLADFCLHFRMSLLNTHVCAKRAITLDIIMASGIVWPPVGANSLPFYNC